MLLSDTWSFTTIPAFIARAAEVYGDSAAIEDGGRIVSYNDLLAESRQFARALMATGIKAGERVMILSPNSWQWIVAAMGIATAGAVLIPGATRFKGPELEDIALRGGVRLVVSCGTFLGQDYPAMLTPATRAGLTDVVVTSHTETDTNWDDFLARAAAVSETELDARIATITPDSTADILFTSGTTGRSKGVMFGHAQFLKVVSDWTNRVGMQRGDRCLIIPPFFHAFGYRGGAVGSLIVGATILPHLTFDAEEILKRVERDKVSVIPGPPAIFQGMLHHPQMADFDRSSLRLGVTGGAVIPAVLVERMRSDLGFAGVCNGYGLTECGGYGSMCRWDDSAEVIANTAGKPMDDVEIAMMDSEGNILPHGASGEVVIRGFITMKGYFEDPEGTAATIDAQGWLHTGDIGRFREDGNLVIEDRLKDMYIVGGFNCYPAEIERMLSRHPAIEQAAVIGVPDERQGEIGRAYVVLRPHQTATEAEIIAWSRENMANYKVPRSVVICEKLPTSPQGKVLKRELRATFG